MKIMKEHSISRVYFGKAPSDLGAYPNEAISNVKTCSVIVQNVVQRNLVVRLIQSKMG